MKSKINLEIEGGVCGDLVAWSVDLDEAFGEPYRAVVTAVSDKVRTPDALRADALGCHAKLTLEQFFDDGVIRRFLGGIVTSVCHEGSASLHPAWLATSGQERPKGSVYSLVIEPSIVRLREARRTEDYPDTTPLKVIQAVLARNGITPVVEKTRVEEEPYSGQVRFVQADETDWDFLHRILARYGLTYAFSHDADGNELLFLTEGRDFPVASALDFSDLPACDDTVRLRFSCTRHEAGTYPLRSFAARRGIVAGGRRTSFLLPLAPTGVSAS